MGVETADPRTRGIDVSHAELQLIAEIDEFKGRWESLRAISPERLRALRRVATIESIGSSTRIEGVKLTDREIEALLSNVKRHSFRSRDEQEVAGYAKTIELVFESWAQLTLSKNHIKQLHSLLLKYSLKDEHHRGHYKRLQNNVVAYGPDGREIGVIFETTAPFQTPWEMERLIEWANQSAAEKWLHPLLIAAAFTVCFLAIHPFQDGNGRLSRILTTLLLLRAGYVHLPYASLEAVIEENKSQYYATLRATQATLKGSRPNWQPWILFFLKSLKNHKDILVAKLEREQVLAESLHPLSTTILSLLRQHGQLSISELERLTGANRNTVKVRLRDLTRSELIFAVGKARATRYKLGVVS